MEDNDSACDDEFRFPWEHLADFYAVFRPRSSTDDTIVDYDCCLSRVHLNDKDLVKLSERKRGTEAVDTKSLVESVGAMDLSDHDNEDGLILQASTAESDALDKNGTGPLELTSDAWSELPKHFGSTKKHAHTRYYRKRKSTVSDAQKWLRNTTFEEYWEDTASYLIYRSWLEDYGRIMNEDDRNNLKKQVEDCKPMALIDEHTDEKISKYFGLTKDVLFNTYEKLFAVHCEKVHSLAEKDFAAFRIAID